MTAVLTRGLQTVRAEFNSVFPDRDKASDGWIGNLAHQQGVSGHNPDKTKNAEYKDGDALDEVRAIDVDKDLRDPEATMEDLVQYLVQRARSGAYVPFRYLIYRRRIWSRTTGWATRAYTGANAHDEHLHISGDYTQKADNWTGSLGLASLTEKDDEDMTPAELLTTHIKTAQKDYGQLNGAVATLMERTDNLANSSVPELEARIKTIGVQLASITSAVTALAATVAEVNQKVSTALAGNGGK